MTTKTPPIQFRLTATEHAALTTLAGDRNPNLFVKDKVRNMIARHTDQTRPAT